jgi:KUP system potassium uptake protein
VAHTFYQSIPYPQYLYWPVFCLATLSTIIASQALLAGANSLIAQAVKLQLFPTVNIKHTSDEVEGTLPPNAVFFA